MSRRPIFARSVPTAPPPETAMRTASHRRQGSILLLLMMSVIMIMIVVAFGFMRAMQMSRGTTQVQRKDDLARLAAEMGMQHAIAVCTRSYAMASEVRDDQTVPAVSRFDSLESNAFKLLSARASAANITQHSPMPWDMSPELPFQNMFDSGWQAGARTVGYTWGTITKSGYSRWIEANRFAFDPTSPTALYDPATYDLYDPLAPNPAVVKTPFPPVDPFVRGAAVTRRHAGDNPLLLDADYRPVTDSRQARFRLRYAVDVQDMSTALWLNTDMPWLTPAGKAQARAAYKECLYAVGMQLGIGYDRSDTFENIFLGHGAYANSRFVNGQARDWPERGGGPMWYRPPNSGVANGRAYHCVFGSPYMNWNDPGGTWIGSAIPSFNDLAFAMQDDNQQWHNAGEVKDNEPRARGDRIAQFNTTPFGRPDGAATDHPWAVNALAIAPRTLEAMVAAYMPPVVRSVAVTSETCLPYCETTDAFGNITRGFRGAPIPGKANPLTWSVPIKAYLTVPGSGPDLFTDGYMPRGQVPFAYPTPAMRDYWTTPVGPAGTPSAWRADHTPVADARSNAERYPGESFFSIAATEPMGQCLTRWRGHDASGAAYDSIALACQPRQVESDPATANPPAPVWALGTTYAFDDRVDHSGTIYVCRQLIDMFGDHDTDTVKDANDPDLTPGMTPRWMVEAPIAIYPPTPGVDHLGRHIVFYKADAPGVLAVKNTVTKYLSVANYTPLNAPSGWNLSAGDNINHSAEFTPGGPFSPGISGAGTDGFVSAYKGSSSVIYTPAVPVATTNEVYPAPDWGVAVAGPARLAAQVTAAQTAPPARGPLGVVTPETWQVSRSAGSWGAPAKNTCPNSYYNRLSLAFWHAVFVAQAATMAWADRQDSRRQAFVPANAGDVGNFGVFYATSPDLFDFTSYQRKGPASWAPAAADFDSIEAIDRQFVANMGESFASAGRATPAQAAAQRPPRYLGKQRYSPKNSSTWTGGTDGSTYCYTNYVNMRVAEYLVSNNIRTLLTPLNTAAGGTLTARSTDAQAEPPHRVWLLDEWNAEADAAYTPGAIVGTQPTRIARARARMMERVLNDWRLSFLGASRPYADRFRPKDFDGDGRVFCSGYLTPSAADADTGLTCWKSADANGDGPGNGVDPSDPAQGDASQRLTVFSVTGCLTVTRSRQFKIHVRGELYDNFVDRAVSEQYLESALLIDPDGDVTRGAVPTGLTDSVLIMQRPIHNYYRGLINRAYP